MTFSPDPIVVLVDGLKSMSPSSLMMDAWQVADADQGAGITDFAQKGELWKKRRALAKSFWTD